MFINFYSVEKITRVFKTFFVLLPIYQQLLLCHGKDIIFLLLISLFYSNRFTEWKNSLLLVLKRWLENRFG